MRTPRTRSEQLAVSVLGACCMIGLLFLMLPILVIIPLSFDSERFFSYPMPGVSFRWYQDIAGSAAWHRALGNSLIVGGCATVLATALGGLASIGLSRLRSRGKALITAILISPMMVPGVVTALAVYLFYSSLGLTGNLLGIIVAHSILGIPFVVITLTAALIGFDANLMRAAASLGAPPRLAIAKVMVPLLTPAILSSSLFVFATSFDEFIVTLFLAGPGQFTLPLQMWTGVHDDVTPAILAAATLFVLTSILMLISIDILRRRAERLSARRIGEA